MDPIALVCALAFFPGVRTADFSQPRGFVVMDAPFGSGSPARKGDRITINFAVKSLAGEDIADSDKRGLPYTFRIGDAGNDRLLEIVTQGMRDHASRIAILSSTVAYGADAPDFVTRNQDLLVTVTTIAKN